MAIGKTNAGGGSGNVLNFDVKRYATEAKLLEDTPKENTIGIISTTEMTGWIIDANQPENLTQGMVWISNKSYMNVSFNALKKNGIQVYPLSARQYVSGAWEDTPTKIYQNDRWLELSITLFPPASNWNGATDGHGHAGINSDGITLQEEWISYQQYQQATTISSWDVTPYSRLCARMKTSTTNCTKVVALSTEADSNVLNSTFVAKVTSDTQTAGTIIELDISSLSGQYYVAVGQYTTSGSSNNYTIFDKVWMK